MVSLTLSQLTIFLFLSTSLIQAHNPTNSRKLDENPPDLENKCGPCPCDNPCSPPHPPPSPPPPSPPPPPKKPPTTSPSYDCPPPPAVPSEQKPPTGTVPTPDLVYINGPPGSVYPISANISGGHRCFLIGTAPFLISFGLWVLAF